MILTIKKFRGGAVQANLGGMGQSRGEAQLKKTPCMIMIETGRMMTIRMLMLLMVLLLLVILTKAIFFANLLLQCLRRCRLDGVWSLEQARVQWDCGEEGHQVVVAHLGV